MKTCCGILLLVLCLPEVVHAQKKDAADLITKDTQKAIDAGLKYLAKEQAADGSFGTGAYKGNIGVTSLAGLALLAAKPGGDQEQIVAKTVRYIVGNQDKASGMLNSRQGALHGPMYGHGFAVLFLADAHEKIADKKLKTEVREALEHAVKLLITAQNREGGWRYLPNSPDADVTVTACQVAALRAARDAGIEIPKETFNKVAEYVKRCQTDDGGFRYQAGFGGASGFARSAAALNSLNRSGVKDGEVIDKGMKYLRDFDRAKGSPEWSFHYSYGHYYAAKTMWYAGDKDFQKWYPTIRDELLQSQKDDHWRQGTMCPHYDTAIALIILQMPDGRLPSLKR
jgi:Prenyltransferase and squalene oxidase repeat